MTQINKQIDRLIVRLKRNAAFENVRFIRAYGGHEAEIPVRGMLAAVNIRETSLSRTYIGEQLTNSLQGEQYTAEVEIKLYAPRGKSDNSLSELAGELIGGLKEADEEKIITEIKASPVEFDADIGSIFRKVTFSVDFWLCKEDNT